jgi:alpha-tubulin suppressor-like RCC1 family protein
MIAGGVEMTDFVNPGGDLYVHGRNRKGQLGNGYGIDERITTHVLSNVMYVCVGNFALVAIKTDYTAWVSGWNERGQLGLGHLNDVNTLTPNLLTGVVQAHVNAYTAFYIKKDGTVYGTGEHYWGQFCTGQKRTGKTSTPVKIPLTDVVGGGISGDGTHFYIKSDRTLWVCGANSFGEAGQGHKNEILTATQIMTGVKSLCVGAYVWGKQMFLKTDGTLYSAGMDYPGDANEMGGLCDGVTPSGGRTSFYQVDTNVTEVTCFHNEATFYLKSDSSFWACGWGRYIGRADLGQKQLTPIQLDTGVSRLATGSAPYHTYMIKSGGTVWHVGTDDGGFGGSSTWTEIPQSEANMFQ